MEFVLEFCLWLAGKVTREARDNPVYPGWRERQMSRGLLGLGLFLFLVVGVPALAVVWGYASGRLPAASPYVD
jgi:hypothetical protein